MKIKELLHKKSLIDASIAFCGASKGFQKMMDNFSKAIKSRYSQKEFEHPNFLKKDVPEDIEESFKPLWALFRKS